MKKSLLILWLLLFICNTKPLFAQLPSISFEYLNTQDGLPSSTVLYAHKDNKGFMWFGTRKCPTRYDGYSFRNFLELETGMVLGVASDKANNIYIASDLNRICKIENNSFKMLRMDPAHEKPSNQTGYIFIDSKGNGWYSDWYGINKIDLKTEKSKHYPFRQTNYVWVKASFTEDQDGNIWIIGTDNGLFKYEPESDKIICVLGVDAVNKDRQLPIVFSQGIIDHEGYLWLGTYNYGLIKYNVRDHTFEIYNDGLQRKNTRSIEDGFDENGNHIIWYGDDEGLGIFRPDQKMFYSFEDILPNPFRVNHIFRDKEQGIVWISTSEGILKYHPKSNLIKSVYIPPGLVRFPVTLNVFLKDKNDPAGATVFIGLSHTGILKWNRTNNDFKLINFPPDESAAEVRWMIQKEDGNIWIGTNKWNYKRPGIFIYDPHNNRFLNNPQILEANRYFSVPFFMYGKIDQMDRLWVGNSDEGFHIVTPEGKEVTPVDSLSQYKLLLKDNNLINDMMLDRNGKLWLGTFNGLYYLDEIKKSFVNTDTSYEGERPQDLAINSIFQDRKGNIWAARWGSITQSDPEGKLIMNITVSDGLFDRENKGIAEDKNGNFWFGNFDGLHHFNVETKKLLGFTINEGLISNNTINRLFILDGSELIIGQKNGFNILDIDKLYAPQKNESIEISSFKVHDKQFDQDFSQPIILSRQNNSFTAEFVSLNYSKIQNDHFAYFLEGVDKSWKSAGKFNIASYNNLGPGKYKLHLKAGDAFGNWNTVSRNLEIRILPAFYETWLFRVSMLFLFLLILYALYKYRITQLIKLQQVRNRISADLHDEIGSSLSGISIMGVIARNNLNSQHPSTPFIQKILEETSQISTSLDDIVWSINPQNDELSNLVARMTRYASEILEAKNITYTLNIPAQLAHAKLSMEQRRDFYMIFKESINNLVKYAQCSQVCLKIYIKDKRLYLTIQDNGKGFDPDAPTDRNGIRNMKRRAANLKGSLKIKSAPKEGTSIALEFPF